VLLVLLSVYSIVASYLLARRRAISKRTSALDGVWEGITGTPNPSPEAIMAIAEIAKVRQAEIPWYERSLSTIGILAFLSMIVATGFQTINSAKAEAESASLRREAKILESQRNSWKKLVKELSGVVVLKQASFGKIDKSEEEVLRQRLDQIDEIEKPGKDEDTERLKIYLALKQYDDAAALIHRSTWLSEGVSSENLLFLAEMSFVDGAKGEATSLLNHLDSQLSKQPLEWQLRYFVIRAAIDSDLASYSRQIAAIKGLSLEDAQDWLQRRVSELRQQASRRSLAGKAASDR
jgi:hypothetical protein